MTAELDGAWQSSIRILQLKEPSEINSIGAEQLNSKGAMQHERGQVVQSGRVFPVDRWLRLHVPVPVIARYQTEFGRS
jgi:hypothetical protein